MDIVMLTKTFEEYKPDDIDEKVNKWISEMYAYQEITGFTIVSITPYATEDYHSRCIIYTMNKEYTIKKE